MYEFHLISPEKTRKNIFFGKVFKMCDFTIVSGVKKALELEKVVKFSKKVKNREQMLKIEEIILHN
jgi:hypothetical protein